MLHLPQQDLGGIECLIILYSALQDHLVARSKRLDHGPARLLSAAATADHLRDQRKCALGSAIISGIKALVCRENADQCYIFKIQPLRDHLRPDHHGDIAFPEAFEQLFVGGAARQHVSVHTKDFHPRKGFMQFLFHQLGSGSNKLQDAAAVRADFIQAADMPAIVADQTAVDAVIRQRDAAVRALIYETALHTGHQFPGTAPV